MGTAFDPAREYDVYGRMTGVNYPPGYMPPPAVQRSRSARVRESLLTERKLDWRTACACWAIFGLCVGLFVAFLAIIGSCILSQRYGL
jgi:hypothetical protein